MAITPTGETSAAPPAGTEIPLSRADAAFMEGLEKIIDRALKRHTAGERFVYGVHQGLSPAMASELRRRYVSAGWRDVVVKESGTGAHLLVLTP